MRSVIGLQALTSHRTSFANSNAQRRQRRALTLLEMIVVLVILTLLTTAVLPAGSVLLLRARGRDVQQRIESSWRLARVLALSRNEPVFWELRQVGSDVNVAVRGGEGEQLLSIKFNGWQVRDDGAGELTQQQSWRVRVTMDGLTESLELHLNHGEQNLHFKLPGVIDEPPATPAHHKSL